MGNMSYCRFRNTEKDMDDCLDALRSDEISSDAENSAGKRMLKSVLEFCKDNGIIDDFDVDAVDSVVDDATNKEDEE
jgi:hypothetical protein